MVFTAPWLTQSSSAALLTLPSLETASNALRAFIGGSFIELPYENLMSLSK
jgi:hypothetical protein